MPHSTVIHPLLYFLGDVSGRKPNDFHNPLSSCRVLGSVYLLPWRYGENVIWQELPVYRIRRFSRPFDIPGDSCWHVLRGGNFRGDGCREGFVSGIQRSFSCRLQLGTENRTVIVMSLSFHFSSKSFDPLWIRSIGSIPSKSMYCPCLAVFDQSSGATPEYEHSPCLFLSSSTLDDPRDWSRRKQDKTSQTLLVKFVSIRLL